MAIFIPHIKGCDANSKVYNWLDFINTKDQNPKVLTATVNNKTESSDHGFMITSNLVNQSIDQPITIPNILGIQSLKFENTDNYISADSNYLFIHTLKQLNLISDESSLIFTGKDPQDGEDPNCINMNAGQDINMSATNLVFSATSTTGSQFAKGYVVIGKNDSSTKEEGNLYIQNSCNALYFNATSDVRAKTNLQHASFNALNIVRSLPVYTFNYKNDSSPAIGLVAQDAEKISFGTDFSLVNNITASGENGDYMSIKESKLVYILWKAIQEQQEQINKLTSLVKDLSRK